MADQHRGDLGSSPYAANKSLLGDLEVVVLSQPNLSWLVLFWGEVRKRERCMLLRAPLREGRIKSVLGTTKGLAL